MIWVDVHLSPAIARWITLEMGHPARSVRDLGLRQAKDHEIFEAARKAGVIVMTKDADFPEMVLRLGPPPQVIWLTCGNTSDGVLRGLVRTSLPKALEMALRGEPLVEIS